MSLFQLREYWRSTCGTDEEFDNGCMVLGNVDNEATGEQKIVMGSFQGVLRIYSPKSREYSADHLLMEMQLNAPILQLAIGRFTLDPGVSLAVLHPRVIIVYKVVCQGGIYALQKVYDHTLEHTAANFAYGPFGGMVGSDLLCVQSMDGQLSFFEREVATFTRYLPNFLVPGPLLYIEQMDAFLTCSSAMEIDCFKYQILAAATSEKQAMQGLPGSAPSSTQAMGQQLQSKKVQPTWSFVLGEMALDIRAARLTTKAPLSQVDICVLGERNFFVLSESGQLRYERRLDFIPTAMCPYYFEQAPNRMNVLLASSTGNLMVLDMNKPAIVWSAKGETKPIQLAVSRFGDLAGLVVSMDDTGSLVISYLGTSPQTKIVQVPENEFDYEALETEHRMLLAKIRDATSNKAGRGESMGDKMILRTQIPQTLDSLRGTDIDDMNAGGSRSASTRHARTLTAMIFLTYAGKGEATDITITVDAPPPVSCRQPRFTLPSIQGGARTPCVVSLVFECTGDCPPVSSSIQVSVAYLTETGQQRVVATEFAIPMVLVCKPIPAVKDAQFKVTVDTNKPPPRLGALFEDALNGPSSSLAGGMDLDGIGGGGGAANVLSFSYPDGTHCTIVVSKNAGRYRIQSNTYAGLGYVTEELCRRLTAYYGGSAQSGPAQSTSPLARVTGPDGASSSSAGGAAAAGPGSLKLSLVDPVPIADLFEVIDAHFALRKKVHELDGKLDKAASLYRAVEKRLLVRFKDKNPQPLNKLEDLLRHAHRDLSKLSDDMTQTQVKLMKEDTNLSASLEVTVMLARLALGLNDKAVEILRGYLNPSVHDAEGAEPGWEEITEAATTHLLKTALGKEGAATGAAAVVTVQEILQDTEKLKKNITNIFDRLQKGAVLG